MPVTRISATTAATASRMATRGPGRSCMRISASAATSAKREHQHPEARARRHAGEGVAVGREKARRPAEQDAADRQDRRGSTTAAAGSGCAAARSARRRPAVRRAGSPSRWAAPQRSAGPRPKRSGWDGTPRREERRRRATSATMITPSLSTLRLREAVRVRGARLSADMRGWGGRAGRPNQITWPNRWSSASPRQPRRRSRHPPARGR